MEKIKKIVAIFMAVCIALNLAVVPGGRQKVQAAQVSGDGNYEYVVLDENTVRIKKYNGTTNAEVAIPDSIEGKDVVEIGPNAFEQHTEITAVYITGNAKKIASYAFYNCKNLRSVMALQGVTVIEDYAFAACENLTEIEIPNSVSQLKHHAFYCCLGLKNITIPMGVDKIEDSTFEGCAGLTEITIPDSVTSKIGRASCRARV